MNEELSYEAARDEFRQRAERTGGVLEALPADGSSPHGAPLTIDTAWFGPRDASSVLIYTSGVHGVEGFAGSLLQRQLINRASDLPAGVALLMVHAVNPFGMAWLRRVNANNVDLNRNCLAPGESYSGCPPDFARLTAFLHPESLPKSFDGFYLRAAMERLRFGHARLAQAIASGQYEYPRGLFFGGKQLEQEPQRLLAWMAPKLEAARQMLVLDLHTGLGRFGEDTLLISEPAERSRWQPFRRVWGPRLRGPDTASYQARGMFCDAIARLVPHAECWGVVHEFGTYSSIRVLKALRAENRLWWYGDRNDLAHPVKQTFAERFFPSSADWRSRLLTRGRAVLEEALKVLGALEGGRREG